MRPAIDNVFSCKTNFRVAGKQHAGPWMRGATWNPLEEPHVQGRVLWPEASFVVKENGADRSIETNGLPVGVPTGIFPIARGDPA